MRAARATCICALSLSPLWMATGCSSEDRRDQFYGTDVGVNYELPEAGINPPLPDAAAPDTAAAPIDAASDAQPVDGSTDAADGGPADVAAAAMP